MGESCEVELIKYDRNNTPQPPRYYHVYFCLHCVRLNVLKDDILMLTANCSVLIPAWSFKHQLHLKCVHAGMRSIKLALQQCITIRRVQCRNSANHRQLRLALPSSFSPLASTFLHNTLPFPLPSCSISASVTTLTFPPLHLPPSSSLVSPFPCLLSPPPPPIVTSSHSSRPENSITIKMFVWAAWWGVVGGEAKAGGGGEWGMGGNGGDGAVAALLGCHCLCEWNGSPGGTLLQQKAIYTPVSQISINEKS